MHKVVCSLFLVSYYSQKMIYSYRGLNFNYEKVLIDIKTFDHNDFFKPILIFIQSNISFLYSIDDHLPYSENYSEKYFVAHEIYSQFFSVLKFFPYNTPLRT